VPSRQLAGFGRCTRLKLANGIALAHDVRYLIGCASRLASGASSNRVRRLLWLWVLRPQSDLLACQDRLQLSLEADDAQKNQNFAVHLTAATLAREPRICENRICYAPLHCVHGTAEGFRGRERAK
jgi:hypothetical protein